MLSKGRMKRWGGSWVIVIEPDSARELVSEHNLSIEDDRKVFFAMEEVFD